MADANDPRPQLSLDATIKLALARNRLLTRSVDNVAGAQFDYSAALSRFETKVVPSSDVGVSGGDSRNSGLDFRLGTSFQRTYGFGTRLSLTPSVTEFGDIRRSALALGLTQPLFRDFGREINEEGVDSAIYSIRQSQRALYASIENTVLVTIRAVYAILRQQEQVRLNEASAERLRLHLEAVRAKLRIGGASRIDLTRARLALRNAEDGLVSAQQGVRDAEDNLKIVLALDLEEQVSVQAPIDRFRVALDEPKAVTIATGNSIEIDQVQDQLENAQRQVRLAERRLLPALDFVAAYSRFGDDTSFDESLDLDREVWSGGLRATTGLSRSVERASLGRARIALQNVERSVAETEDLVTRSARSVLRSLREAEDRIIIQEERIEDAKRQLELSKVRFRYGLADNFSLIDAETELLRAESSLSLVTINQLTGTYAVSAALGMLIPQQTIDAPGGFGRDLETGLPIYVCSACLAISLGQIAESR